jgi:hypothetical protein
MLRNAIESLCRLRGVRDACRDVVGSEGILLVVAGQDGKDNPGSAALLQYLLVGTCGRQLQAQTQVVNSQLASSGVLDPLDDCIIAIGANHVRIYYSAEAVESVAALVSSWANVAEWVLLPSDLSDMERAERFKVCV